MQGGRVSQEGGTNTFLGFSRLIMVDLPELSRPTMMILDFFLPREPPIILIVNYMNYNLKFE